MFERGGWDDDFFVHKGYEYEYVEDRRSSEKLMIQEAQDTLMTERESTAVSGIRGTSVCKMSY